MLPITDMRKKQGVTYCKAMLQPPKGRAICVLPIDHSGNHYSITGFRWSKE